MRVLAPLLILLSLAAACGGGSSPRSTRARVPTSTPAPTTRAIVPFTPVEEALTPPPDIDTSGWLTYKDTGHGFELKYPPDALVKRNASAQTFGAYGVGTEIDLPIARGTSLGDKYLFIKELNEPPDKCVPPELTVPVPEHTVRYIHSGNVRFWKTSFVSGGVGQVASTDEFMAANGNSCVALSAVLAGLLHATPPARPEDISRTIFTAIVSTFRWTQP